MRGDLLLKRVAGWLAGRPRSIGHRLVGRLAHEMLPLYGASLPEMAASGELAVYMHAVEWSQLVAILETLQPRSVLEWGSGGSTRALLERGDFIKRYVAIEHDERWAERIREKVVDPRLVLQHVTPSLAPPPIEEKESYERWCARAETDERVMQSYIQFPRTLGTEFDLVLVDGRARKFCLQEGWTVLRSGGVLVLHDAQRDDYRAGLNGLGRVVFLEPWDQGQIAFARKPVSDGLEPPGPELRRS